MRMIKLWGVAAAVGAMLLTVVPAAAAADQTQTQKPLEYTVTVTGHIQAVRGSLSDHFLSFSGPVEIPGVVLKPGTYIFQPLHTGLVRVMSVDHKEVYATFFTLPVVTSSAGTTQVTFERTGNEAPVRIAAWFPSGQPRGDEAYGMAPTYPTGPSAKAPMSGD